MRELAAPAGAGRIVVELVAVPRIMLDPQLAQLREAGIAVDAVDVAAGDGRMGVNLLPADQTPHRRRPRLRLNLALAGGCLLLLVLVLWQWLHNREVALERMRDEVAALRTQAQAVAALRQQWQDEVGAAGFLARRKRQAISRLALLNELTRRLPASAWLERFSLDGSGQFTMQGQAQQAIKLIDALKESPLIVDPNFQGSIQPDPASGKDRFYLLAQLRQPAASAAKPVAGDAR
jgi:general secretion pathway protein L